MPFRVTLIGHYPPPFGGVGSLMLQMEGALEEAGCRVTIWNLGRGRPTGERVLTLARRNRVAQLALSLLAFLRSRDDVFHYIAASYRSFPLGAVYVLLGRLCGKRMVMSLVGGNFDEFVDSLGPLERALARLALRASTPVACSSQIADVVSRLVRGGPVATVTNSFPLRTGAAAPLPPVVQRFIEEHEPIVCTTGAAAPEYGLEGALEAVGALAASRFPRIGFVVVLTPYGTPDGESAFLAATNRHALAGRVLVARGLPDFTALLRRSDAFVRPALVDGDSISVREALSFGVPTVASDTPFRPEGTVVFRKGDAEDMAARLADAFASGRCDPAAAHEESARNIAALLEVYSRVAGRSATA
jgi:glycosyltransferase involved in cell wall biosynthesis